MPFVDLSSITQNAPSAPVTPSEPAVPVVPAADPVSPPVTPVVDTVTPGGSLPTPADNSVVPTSDQPAVIQPVVTQSVDTQPTVVSGQSAVAATAESVATSSIEPAPAVSIQPAIDTSPSPQPQVVETPVTTDLPEMTVASEPAITPEPAAETPGTTETSKTSGILGIPEMPQIPEVSQAPDLDGNGLPDLEAELKPGSVAPIPVDLNEFSPGELNSLNIEPFDPNQDDASLAFANGKNKVGLEIDENGVKTITGPALSAHAAKAAQSADLGDGKSQVNTGSSADAPAGSAVTPPTAKPEAAKFNVTSGEQLQTGATIEDIMALAEQKKASDIHFSANYPVMLRIDGRLTPVSPRLTGEQSADLGKQLLNPERQQKFAEAKELDFSFTNANQTRFRVNLFTERDNVAGALRLIEKNIRTMKELDLPDVLFEIVDEPHGLVLVVGPTGSGKSTTLAAMLNHINMNRADHILTIEDPIEYVYPQEMSIVNQREVGADTHAWQAALKSALREDPDVVLVGEMRDLDTIESTITIAETGHLTFATLHTNSAAQAIDRIIDVFPEGSKEQIRAQLANVITAVVSQRLIPVQIGGRKAALEVMLGTVAVRNAIREGKTYQIDNIIQTSGDLGMVTLEKSLVNLVKKGYISKDVAKAHSAKPDEIDSLLNNLRI